MVGVVCTSPPPPTRILDHRRMRSIILLYYEDNQDFEGWIDRGGLLRVSDLVYALYFSREMYIIEGDRVEAGHD